MGGLPSRQTVQQSGRAAVGGLPSLEAAQQSGRSEALGRPCLLRSHWSSLKACTPETKNKCTKPMASLQLIARSKELRLDGNAFRAVAHTTEQLRRLRRKARMLQLSILHLARGRNAKQGWGGKHVWAQWPSRAWATVGAGPAALAPSCQHRGWRTKHCGPSLKPYISPYIQNCGPQTKTCRSSCEQWRQEDSQVMFALQVVNTVPDPPMKFLRGFSCRVCT